MKYTFPLCIQLAPVDDILNNSQFRETLELLKQYGFYGVELNITDFEINPAELVALLDKYNLKITMVATGAYANKHGLSLSSVDEAVRKKTVEKFKEIIDFAVEVEAGIICGFIKGGANGDYSMAKKAMETSLEEISGIENYEKTDIYLEATNHYESILINTVSEGSKMVSQYSNIMVLPDTYHMNIEEIDPYAILCGFKGQYGNVHISDNNRYFPGLGAIDFSKVFTILKSMDYEGTVSIEGRCLNELHKDIRVSAEYLEDISKRILLNIW